MAPKCIIYTGFLWAFLLIVTSRTILAVNGYRSNKDPSAYYTTLELICGDGYPAQEHKITTDDGYILTVHRIPNGKRRPKVKPSVNHYFKVHRNYHPDFENCVKGSLNETSKGLPILLVHGVLQASDGWVLQGPGYDFAYLLSDAGYDVWMMNVRGNFYSRGHKTLRISDPEYWDFSFHENAYYDIPATIDYILRTTKQEKIFYVGFSMGTTIFFVFASTRPEYNDKVLGFVGLAPVVFSKQEYLTPRRKRFMNTLFQLMEEMRRRGNVYELFPRNINTINLGIICSLNRSYQDFCYNSILSFLGDDSRLFLRKKGLLYGTHWPTGTSLKTLLHYGQEFRNNQFKWYDYGYRKNVHLYGSPNPPDYPIWNITTPIALYYSTGDFFYDVKDEKYLQGLLQNVVDVKILSQFNHGDFLWGYTARDLVYKRALSFLKTRRDQYYLSSSKKNLMESEKEQLFVKNNLNERLNKNNEV